MSPMQDMKDRRGKCIFYGSLLQETGGLTPMVPVLGCGHFGVKVKMHYFFEKSSYVLLAIM